MTQHLGSFNLVSPPSPKALARPLIFNFPVKEKPREWIVWEGSYQIPEGTTGKCNLALYPGGTGIAGEH